MGKEKFKGRNENASKEKSKESTCKKSNKEEEINRNLTSLFFL
jgi:hypothetical protein